jgi:hypothetical protein
MAICSCGLPARCCQPAVAGGFIYADLRSELNSHLALQALFTQSPVREPLLQAFPFPSTMGEVTLHPPSPASVFIYSLRGKLVFPPLLWSFPPTATFTSFPASDCWVCAPAWPSPSCLFIYSSVRHFPSPLLQHSGCPTLFAMCLLCYCLLFSFFFPWVGVSLSRGLC